jgi:hypothetical protein
LRRIGLVICALALTACGYGAGSAASAAPMVAHTDTPTAEIEASPIQASATPATSCQPTDQDKYVYSPDRLKVEASCIRVTGTVAAIRSEADGDLHILLALDAPYRHLLTPANQGEELGDLVVEPICVLAVTQADAVASCAADPDPLRILPGLGWQIWMEGRYVFDEDHGGWAELHPLFRWASLGAAPAAPTAKPSPRPVSAWSVRFTRLTSPVRHGAYATAAVATAASAYCTITVTYKSGSSKAAGLGPKTASPIGTVSWTWLVGPRTTPGSWPVTVTCSKGGASSSATKLFQVT